MPAPMPEPPDHDPALWFEMPADAGCPGRHYLLGNAHTVPGRMLAWCPRERRSHFVSKPDVATCSPEARYWIAGFLSGNEPPPPHDEHGVPTFEGERAERWRAAVALFAETGYWNARARRCERCGDALLPSEPGAVCAPCRAGS